MAMRPYVMAVTPVVLAPLEHGLGALVEDSSISGGSDQVSQADCLDELAFGGRRRYRVIFATPDSATIVSIPTAW